MKTEIVCLCGSTRFWKQFQEANYDLTMKGKIVLTVGCMTSSDRDLGVTEEQKTRLDALHLQKIDLSDRVLVLNVDGYIGESTTREIAYAIYRGKMLSFLDEIKGEEFLSENTHRIGRLVASFSIEKPR